MSKLLIWVTGNKVIDGQPSERYQKKLDRAVDLYHEHKKDFDEIEFLMSGRWSNSVDDTPKTEARVGKEFIQSKLPEAHIMEENISVETIGNFAFAKPLIISRTPDKVIGLVQTVMRDRILFLQQKVFADQLPQLEWEWTEDNTSTDEIVVKKNTKALEVQKKLLGEIQDGDDSAVRDTILYKTPYYFRLSEEQNRAYFDTYWPGGFDDFIGAKTYHSGKR